MKTKETLEPKQTSLDKTLPEQKPKSLRPMRSMVAVRSLKPKTTVATMNLNKAIENSERA
jgi:hypothetical protein